MPEKLVFGEVFFCQQCGRVTTRLFDLGVRMNGQFQGKRVCCSCLPANVTPLTHMLAALGMESIDDLLGKDE